MGGGEEVSGAVRGEAGGWLLRGLQNLGSFIHSVVCNFGIGGRRSLTEGSGTRATLRVRDTRDAHLGFWKDTIVTRRPSGRGRVSPVPESSAPPAARVIAKRYPKSGLTRAAGANQHEKYLSEMKRVVTPETFPTCVGAGVGRGAARGRTTTAHHRPSRSTR